MKKFFTLFMTFIFVFAFCGVAFADNNDISSYANQYCGVGSSLPSNYSLPLDPNSEVDISITVDVGSFGLSGHFVSFPLVGNYAANTVSNGVVYVSTFEGLTWAVDNVVDGTGTPVPFFVNHNTLYVCCGKGGLDVVNFNLVFSSSAIIPGIVENLVTVNTDVLVSDLGVLAEYTLYDLLDVMQIDISDISLNMEVIRQYLFAVKDEAGETNDNLTYILNQLEWIVSEMEGNVVSNLLGEYAGYNYSQLFVEMINAIKNISIGDITGNITVQTDLSQVISNLVTVANAYNNINQFDYTGKMYFRPVNIISRYGPNQGVSQSAYNPSIEYLTLGGKPSFRIVPQESRVYKVDLLNMKLGVGANNTLLPLMPGNYRISFRVLTRSVSSTLSDFDGSTLYLYNTDVGFIPLEWSAVEDSYSSGYFVYSCSVDVYIPTGLNSGSVQLYFPNGSGIWSNNSVWTIEFQQLDLTYVEINDHLEQIAYLIEQTNNLLAQINENIDNSNLGSSLDSYDQIEGTAQNNFEADYSIVTGAIDGVLGVVGSSGLTNVIAFINGNFTNIWNAMGIFKTLIVTSLLFGLALVFVGRSGKVK